MAVTHSDTVKKLHDKLNGNQGARQTSSEYYEASHRLQAIGISTPKEMRVLTAAVGWPRLYVDSIEERLDIEGFRISGKSAAIEKLNRWWQGNDLDEESGLGFLDSLVYGRSYITIAAPDPDAGDDPDTPIIRVESPQNMYAEVDPRTNRVVRAVRVIETADPEEDDKATLYLPDDTVYMTRGGQGNEWSVEQRVNHKLGVVPVVPVINRARLADRDGRSEITPELRSVTDAASRTMMNMGAAAELMAVPQRLIFGVEPEDVAGSGSSKEILDAYMARIMAFEEADGSATQFTAAELANFTTVLQELSKHVAAYTGLPPQYLSFSTENPASAEAIRSAESRLVKTCERKARMFGGAWELAMKIAVMVMDGPGAGREYDRLETIWRDPATPTYAAKADAVSKAYAAGVIPLERARIDMGYNYEERQEMKTQDAQEPMGMLSAVMNPRGRPSRSDTESASSGAA